MISRHKAPSTRRKLWKRSGRVSNPMTSSIKQWHDCLDQSVMYKLQINVMIPLRLHCPSSSSTPHTAPYPSSHHLQSVRPRSHTPATPSAARRSRDSVSPSASFPSQRLVPRRNPSPMLALLSSRSIQPHRLRGQSIRISLLQIQQKEPREI